MGEKAVAVREKRYTHNLSTQKKWGGAEWIIAGCVLLIRILFYLAINKPQIEADTKTYIELTWNTFLEGERMPLYPLLIQVNRLLLHDGYLMGVVGCQTIVSLIAVWYLYRAVRIATENRKIACVIAFFYGGNPLILQCDVQILTESLALSISVFLLYHTVCYIRSHSFRSGMAMVICILLAVLLKSAMFVYVIAYLIFMAIQFFCLKDMRKTIWKLSAALLGIVFLLLIHAGQVWINAGTFSIDKRGPTHILVACLETDLYQNYPDQELVEKIEKIWPENDTSVDVATTLNPIRHLFGETVKERIVRINEFNRYCIRSDPSVFIKYMLRRFAATMGLEYKLTVSDVDEGSPALRKIYQIQLILFPLLKIGHVYLICGAVLLLLIAKWKRDKECPWYYLGTAGMILVILVSVTVGTYSSYKRCSSYVLPFAFFGLALLLKDFLAWIES